MRRADARDTATLAVGLLDRCITRRWSGALSPGAAHVGVAAFHAVDYLLTCDCKHLANANHAENRVGVPTLGLMHRDQV